jgi:hypothetical protein
MELPKEYLSTLPFSVTRVVEFEGASIKLRGSQVFGQIVIDRIW